MSITDDLYAIETKLKEHSDKIKDKKFNEPLDNLENAAKKIGKSWSGSWLGYQSLVYYEGLAEPPSGARFSQECGLTDMYISDTKGKWIEYKFEEIINVINDIAGNPNVSEQEKQSAETQEYFEEAKSSILSSFSIVLESRPNDKYIEGLKEKAEKQKVLYARDFINASKPSQAISADSIAIEQGFKTPPHIAVISNVYALRQPLIACDKLAKIANRLASHLKKQGQGSIRDKKNGTKVFIGHGSSLIWRHLKDFIQDRLNLPWDEFNRVPIAGVTNTTRLSQMLDEAAIAFLIMTSEDEQVDGKMHARMNVIHEAGLFQGRLGFEKAIIILEEGCEEFSNIQGLGQIRFPKLNIKAAFEEIRQVLEREGILEPKQ